MYNFKRGIGHYLIELDKFLGYWLDYQGTPTFDWFMKTFYGE